MQAHPSLAEQYIRIRLVISELLLFVSHEDAGTASPHQLSPSRYGHKESFRK